MSLTHLPSLHRPASRGVGVRHRAQSMLHWGLSQGLPNVVVRMAARKGDLQGMLTQAGSGEEIWDIVEQVRRQGSLVKGRVTYITADHAVVNEVLTSKAFRTGNPLDRMGFLASASARLRPDTMHPLVEPSLLVTEPPDHTRYRKLVTRVFTMRAVERLRDRAETVAAELLDELAGRTDLVERYCALLPVTLISQILGIPLSERREVLAMGSDIAASLDFGLSWAEYRDVDAGLRRFDAWLETHIETLRGNPGDDLLSQLVQVQDEHGGLTMAELKATAGLVLAAGFETTVNLLGNGIKLLHDHPEELAALRQDPGLWSNAVEEVLRIDPPVLLTARFAPEPTTLGGRHIPAGLQVVVLLAGANRDPEVFADPARFDVTRANAREHLSFSAGRHHCLGAALARMEGEVGLKSFFDRYPDVALLPGAERRPTRILRGWRTLPAQI